MTLKDIVVFTLAIGVPGLMFLIPAIAHICEYIEDKRPHKSDDSGDNPITAFKDDLAEIYENYPNGKLKKLAQAVWDRVEQIEKWHYAEIRDHERIEYSAKWKAGELEVKCDSYQSELDEWTKRCEELQSKLNESQERLKRTSAREKTLLSEADGLRKQYAELQSKLEESQAQLIKAVTIPRFTVSDDEEPDYLIERRFPGQINPFAKAILNKEPLTATEATELAEHLMNTTSQPIVMDSETLNETQTKNEEFVKKLRDWWGIEASKAVEIATPETDKKNKSDGRVHKYKVTLYDMKENETTEKDLLGAGIIEALSTIDRERYGVVGYRRIW